MVHVDRAGFQDYFNRWSHSAWRFECQGVYHEPGEVEPLRRFLAGEPDDLAWYEGWPKRIRAWLAEGKQIGRVRALTDPMTDYLRFEMSLTPTAVTAGEDIRILTADRADDLALPVEDFWIFDDTTVLVMSFGPHGVDGADMITDPERVEIYRERQKIAMSAAILFDEWTSSHVQR